MSDESVQQSVVNSSERPTRVRHLIIMAATLMAFLLYLDRFCVSFASDYIKQDLKLTQNEMSWFLSAFFWSYALAQVPSGWLSDRYGARIMLVIYILSWSFFTALIGASTTFAMLLLTRLGCGLGQAGAYPTAASVVARWVPIRDRGLASAVVANGGRIGGALAPVLTAYLIVLCMPSDVPVQFKPEDLIELRTIQERLQEEGEAAGLRTHLTIAQQNAVDDSSLNDDGMLTLLNRLLETPELFKADQMPSINLPRAGMRLLKQQTRGETISSEQQLLLNRFIIEGLFPQSLARLYRHGWRPILFIYGAAGILVAIFFWFNFRERPDLHPGSNRAEYNLIMQGREQDSRYHGKKLGAAPVRELATSFNMWCCCLMQLGTNIGWLFIMTWLPRYLMSVHGVPIIERGYMTMTPALIGIVGMLMGGRMTDVLAERYGLKWGRRLPIAGSRFLGITAYLLAIALTRTDAGFSLNAPWVFTGLFAIVAFSTDFGAAPTWAFNQDIGGRHVGSVLGWGNMWGNLGAACAPPIYDHFLGENPTLGDWQMMFGICAASFALSAVCSLLIDSSKPLLRDDISPEDAV